MGRRFTLVVEYEGGVQMTPLTPTQGKLIRRRYQKDAWDTAHLGTVSTRLPHDELAAFRARCAELGQTPYARLRDLIMRDNKSGTG